MYFNRSPIIQCGKQIMYKRCSRIGRPPLLFVSNLHWSASTPPAGDANITHEKYEYVDLKKNHDILEMSPIL